MKKLFVVLCGFVLLSSFSALARAEEMKNHKNFSPEMKAKMEQKREQFKKRLNLTPEQSEQMKAFHKSSKAKIQPLFETFKAEKAKLDQLKTSNASKQDIKAQKEKLKQLREKMKEIRKSNFEQVQAILTPDQQKEFNKMREEHKQEFKNKKMNRQQSEK